MTKPLQIATFKWGTKYTLSHVVRLYNMLKRNLTIDWEFVLITDHLRQDTKALERLSIRVIPIWQEMLSSRACGVRLRAFGEDMAEQIGPRFAWIDLDLVIVGNVDHIFGRTEPFISARPPRPPMPIQGSLVMMDAGVHPEVYTQWNEKDYSLACEKLGSEYGVSSGMVSDEGWMWHMLGNKKPSMGREAGIYFFKRDLVSGTKPLPANAAIVMLNGKRFDPSMPALQDKCPWIKEHWR